MEKQVKSICPSCALSKVSPGVDLVRFQLKTPNDKKNREIIRLIIVCRLVKAKGVSYAIDALKHLGEGYRLTIVGDGEAINELKHQAETLGLDKQISFEGKKIDPELWLSNSDIFLLPSLYEPFGQTILEASAVGLPTVAFHSNIVDTATVNILGDLGIYAENLNAHSYADAIRIAEKKVSNENSERLRAHVKNNYSWETLYEDVTAI